ncbi:hypothetical protein GX865_01650 [Candidatus Saccharibacteria bacterium]|jgi:uncharacterized protein HemX|nr:hypothetical protein [Candidatus Saccharibacteria bacterium]
MGLYVRKNEQRSKLQERIASEMREKAKRDSDINNPPVIDGVDDSGFMEGTKSSSSLLGVWLVLLVFGVGVVILLIVRSS